MELSKEKTIEKRNKYIGPSCQLFFNDDPLKIVRAKGAYMYNEKDERYLDCINNVAHVGHCHPKVVEAGYKQAMVLNTNNRYLHDNIVLYAERLCSLFPKELSVVYFTNSGSEANDLALRLAHAHTGKNDIITMDHAYHGHLTTLIDISPYKFNLPGGEGKKDWVHVAPPPDSYRGLYTNKEYSEVELCQKYVDEVAVQCHNAKQNGGLSAFISESMQSCGGQVIFPEGYLRKVYQTIRENGGVCIADEVQVGFGRVGTRWWAFQTEGDDIIPDIVTVGKPIGNGHPISAVITTRKIADSFFSTGMTYFNTFGGNSVSCAIGMAVLDVIEEEGLMANAIKIGNFLKEKFLGLMDNHYIVGDVRGRGMFLGLDLVKNRESREPATDDAGLVLRRLKDLNVIMSTDGPHANVLKFKPPMVFSMENAIELVEKLDIVLTELKCSTASTKITCNKSGHQIGNGSIPHHDTTLSNNTQATA